jgi:Nodulation protein Z (NodZ)
VSGWVWRTAVQAAIDAGRAWAVVPNVHRKTGYARARDGGWRVRYRRRFRLREVLRQKLAAAVGVFVASLRLGFARDVIVTRYGEEGLLANLLHVLEVIRRVRPDARVHVDWTLTGAEFAFRYGEKGQDVWVRLFQPIGSRSAGSAYQAVARVDFAFWGTGKDHLKGRRLQKHREVYHSTAMKWLEITNRRVLAQVDQICTRHFNGRFCIGIHRRVGNAMVASLQEDGRVPTPESIVATVESIIAAATKGGTPDYTVYLATDDTDAVALFKNAFGPKLIVREEVQRTTADGQEVHFGEWGSLSVADAEDVLIDAVLLSQCNVMVHASSSVSTVASILNPALILVRA